jgi:hypothetical protein
LKRERGSPGENLLKPAQRGGFAGADDAGQRDQIAVIDPLLDILKQLPMMRRLVIPD